MVTENYINFSADKNQSPMIENLPQFVMCVTPGGAVEYVNNAASVITGYSKRELIEGGMELIFDVQTVRSVKKELIPGTLRSGRAVSDINLCCKGGVTVFMRFSFFTVSNIPDGTAPLNIGVTATDLTEMKALEHRANTARELADEGCRIKSEFLSRMSHEMRTPMNVILGMANIAKSSGDPKRTGMCLKKIEAASKHMMKVIDDVLDMSDLSKARIDLVDSEFSFEPMLHGVLKEINIYLEEKHQTLSLGLEPGLPANIICDKQRLAQVIINLLRNASKFTHIRGLIQLEANVVDEYNGICTIQIAITDNGIGMSQQQIDKLFTPFEQADGGATRKFGGSGLGLAISKRIIEMMGGTIRVESELGKSSRFIFTFKAGKCTEPTLESASASDLFVKLKSFAGKRALLAEDVEINREIVMAALEDTNLTIDCAINGVHALDLFKAQKYDIVLMDINMPEMDGLEATRRIRALKEHEGFSTPIVALTANVLEKDVEDCLEAGMNDHIGKPIDFNELMFKLEKYLFL